MADDGGRERGRLGEGEPSVRRSGAESSRVAGSANALRGAGGEYSERRCGDANEGDGVGGGRVVHRLPRAVVSSGGEGEGRERRVVLGGGAVVQGGDRVSCAEGPEGEANASGS